MIERLLIIIIIFLPLQFALNVGDNFDLVATRVLVPVIFLLWLVRGMARKRIWIPNKAEAWLVAIFLFLLIASLALGRDASAGTRKVLYFLTLFPIFFVAADIFQDEKWRKCGLVAVVVGGVLAALSALVQFGLPFFLGLVKSVNIWEKIAPFFLGNAFGKLVASNSSWLVNIDGETRMRAFGFFPDPHNFAFFANLCFFASLGYLLERKKSSSKIWTGIAVVLMLAAIALSFSRGAYLGLIAGAIFFAAVFLKRAEKLGKALLAAAGVCILIFLFNSNVITQRLASSFNLREGSNAERYKNWVQAVEIIRDHPLGGVGLGNYARTVDPTAGDRSSIYAHNMFLDIAAEAGILSALVFLALVLVFIWRNVTSGDMLGLGAASGLVAFFAHSLFDTALYSPQVLTMFLVLVALNLYNVKKTA